MSRAEALRIFKRNGNKYCGCGRSRCNACAASDLLLRIEMDEAEERRRREMDEFAPYLRGGLVYPNWDAV